MMQRIIRAASWVFLGVLLGRIAGLCRELIVAHSFGRSSTADIIAIVLTVPDTLLNLLVGGAMAAAFIPQFSRLGAEKAWILFGQSTRLILAIFLVLAGVLAFFPEAIVHLFAPGMDVAVQPLAIASVRIVVFAVPLTAAAAIASSYLQFNESFAVASLSTAVYNCALVGGMIVASKTGSPKAVAGAAIVGALCSLTMQQITARKYKPRQLELAKENLFSRELGTRYFQSFLAGSLIFVLPMIGRSLASLQGEGGIAVLQYTIKLVELPLGVVLTIFSVALLPYLSKCFSEGNHEEAQKLSTDGLRAITIFAFGIAVSIAIGSYPLANLLYGHGKLNQDDVRTIALLGKIGMAGLVPQAIITVQLAVLNSRLDTKSPFYATAIGLGLFFGVAAFLRPLIGLQGISWGFVAAYWTIATILFFVLAKKHGMNLAKLVFTAPLAKALLASACVAVPLGLLAYKFETHAVISVPAVILSAILAPLAGLVTLEPYRRKMLRNFNRMPA